MRRKLSETDEAAHIADLIKQYETYGKYLASEEWRLFRENVEHTNRIFEASIVDDLVRGDDDEARRKAYMIHAARKLLALPAGRRNTLLARMPKRLSATRGSSDTGG